MKQVEKFLKTNEHLIWLEEDEYYKKDIWKLDEHKYYKVLTQGQKNKIVGAKSIDFTLCNNLFIREEIKNACAYLIEYKITKLHCIFHDKFMVDNLSKYFNQNKYKNISILDLEPETILENYEKFLIKLGIETRANVKRINRNMIITEYNERNKTSNLIQRVFEINKAATQHKLKENEKDVWNIRNIDINVNGFNSARPRYIISFERIYQDKIKEVAKKYEYERLKSQKYATIIDDLKGINLLSKFLYERYPKIDSLDKLTREIVLELLGYIETLDMVHTTKGQRKGVIRVFLNLSLMYGFKYAPNKKLISKNDYGKKVTQLPKPISSDVIQKLNENLKDLDNDMARMILVLQNIGMRSNELCRLKIGAVKKDLDGDYFLEYFQSKTDKFNRIPINDEIANIILLQEKDVLEKFPKTKYIFTRDGERPIGQESVSYHINKLALKNDIRDDTGKLYRFKLHHFRHTVATRYVNTGMDPNMIRMMLGHQKIKSIMNYIDLRDATVAMEMEEVLKEQNDIIGSLNGDYVIDPVNNINLINGICTKQINEKPCECINKCYECSMFAFCDNDIENFEKYIDIINSNIASSEENGFQRMLEINKVLKKDIEKLIQKKE